ncbi:MAG TPA: GTP cyclohydrolase I FolE [Ignavibacteriaceae bacterium]|nr:GTP cyclohydrolase I FolE [Ignavibacteriaceae bacterium]
MRDPNFNSSNSEKNKKNFKNINPNDDLINFQPELDGETKIELIESNFKKIMEILGLDLEDDSLKDTPRRVAKMYVKEIFSGLNKENKPSITLFKKKYNYSQMIVEKDITLFSTCEHHFVPIIGKVHLAYFPSDNVIGLSKLNRIVHFISKKPQLQERLTQEIAEELMSILDTEDVAVFIEADHLCVKSRGINDVNSQTVTSSYYGKFQETETRKEFLSYIQK